MVYYAGCFLCMESCRGAMSLPVRGCASAVCFACQRRLLALLFGPFSRLLAGHVVLAAAAAVCLVWWQVLLRLFVTHCRLL